MAINLQGPTIGAPDLLVPPPYCHYAGGPCDQEFPAGDAKTVFFAYPSTPEQIAFTIESCVDRLNSMRSAYTWNSWRNLDVPGKTIFCEVCRGIRTSIVLVADVTTLSFNLMFEIGYAIGLKLPILPIRDTNFIADKRAFEEIGLLDTMGYIDFSNSEQLAARLLEAVPAVRPLLPPISSKEFRQAPLYILKGPIATEGTLRLMSAVKKSSIRFRTYDPIETPRLSLNEARSSFHREVSS
jgi:hypothetical protein